MLGNSAAATVAVVVRMRPQAIPLAMKTMRESPHGFPILSHMSMGLRMTAHQAAEAPPKTKMMSELNSVSAVVPLVPLNGKNYPTWIRYSAE